MTPSKTTGPSPTGSSKGGTGRAPTTSLRDPATRTRHADQLDRTTTRPSSPRPSPAPTPYRQIRLLPSRATTETPTHHRHRHAPLRPEPEQEESKRTRANNEDDQRARWSSQKFSSPPNPIEGSYPR